MNCIGIILFFAVCVQKIFNVNKKRKKGKKKSLYVFWFFVLVVLWQVVLCPGHSPTTEHQKEHWEHDTHYTHQCHQFVHAESQCYAANHIVIALIPLGIVCYRDDLVSFTYQHHHYTADDRCQTEQDYHINDGMIHEAARSLPLPVFCYLSYACQNFV